MKAECVLSCGVPGVLLQSPLVLACVVSDPILHTHTHKTQAHTLPDPSLMHWRTFDLQCCSIDQTYPNPTETTIQHCGATTHTILHYVGEKETLGKKESRKNREKLPFLLDFL